MGIPYIIKTFRGGVSDENNKGVVGAFKYGSSLDIHKRVDSLMGGSAMTTIDSTVVTDLIQFFVPSRDGSTYAFGDSGKIYAIAGQKDDPVVTRVYTDTNGRIKGAGEWTDTSVNGNTYMWWATDTSVSRRVFNNTANPGAAGEDYPWTNVTQNWTTTLDPVDTGWHTMDQAAGRLCIANGNFVATLDNVLSFLPSALNIQPGNIVNCIEERDDYAILGSVRKDSAEEGHIWSWTPSALNWVQKKKIQVRGVNAMIMGEHLFFQGGANGELFNTDFHTAVPLHAIPNGGQVNPGGVSIINELAVFGLYGDTTNAYSGLWTYGRKTKNRPLALNFQYQLATPSGNRKLSTIGAIGTAGGNLYAGWGQTDSDGASFYGIDQVSSTTRANFVYQSLEFDARQPHEKKEFNTVKLTMSPLPASTSVSVIYRLDHATTGGDTGTTAGWKYAVLGDGTTTFSQSGAVEAIFSMGNFANYYEVGVEGTVSGASSPEVLALVTYLTGEAYAYA